MGFQPGAERTMEFPDAIVIGAGPAGLAVAASLQMQELRAVILDKTDKLGSAWRRHYDRLHLHTDRSHSGLPGLAMSSAYGRYPSRAQFIEYLELYAARFHLKPVFNATVSAIRREDTRWRVEAGAKSYAVPIVVVATGWADFPYSPTWPGLETFRAPSRIRAPIAILPRTRANARS
jgi:cation diffusion facilitator CzcD-associated flavoprotein CzcO